MKAGRTADCLVSCLAAYSAAAMAVLMDNSLVPKKEQLLAAY